MSNQKYLSIIKDIKDEIPRVSSADISSDDVGVSALDTARAKLTSVEAVNNFNQLTSSGVRVTSRDTYASRRGVRTVIPRGTAVTPYGAVIEGIVQFVNSPEGQKVMAVANDLAKDLGTTVIDIVKNPDTYSAKIDKVALGSTQNANTIIENLFGSIGESGKKVGKYKTNVVSSHSETAKTAVSEVGKINAEKYKAKLEVLESKREYLRASGFTDDQINKLFREQAEREISEENSRKNVLSNIGNKLISKVSNFIGGAEMFGGNDDKRLTVAKMIVLVLFIVCLIAYVTFDLVELRNLTLLFGFAYLGLYAVGKLSARKREQNAVGKLELDPVHEQMVLEAEKQSRE